MGRTRYAVGQTSSVALDHQMWTRDGELHFRWDVAEERFPADRIELLYAYFVNEPESLADLSQRAPSPRRRLPGRPRLHLRRPRPGAARRGLDSAAGRTPGAAGHGDRDG
ncbi:non-ribosomal peptide synthetase component F [Streptomyces griseochromogenes]|uniref:Non-ribosomal peptide synthetase component F n=1 Tax=Streptomyces griseochromogenes TaxID=68214 RepID=A0A1B1AVI0_9ACTN|nr:hypothetical protein [Streptomyces griseochromogenes]ANP50541.1 hypothetical protein AVL59_13735 [Streptomyces griseochromogenes]MBP2051306.1 non-ribosomal peptide synthetase component F [Streptomyces griseochromogenes]